MIVFIFKISTCSDENDEKQTDLKERSVKRRDLLQRDQGVNDREYTQEDLSCGSENDAQWQWEKQNFTKCDVKVIVLAQVSN